MNDGIAGCQHTNRIADQRRAGIGSRQYGTYHTIG